MVENKTLVFFGNERLATGVNTEAPVLRALLQAGYNVAAVVAKYDNSRGRGDSKLEVEKIAEQHNIPLIISTDLADIENQLKPLKPAAAVLVAYGLIIPDSILDIFPRGIINIHPSLLPQWRGPTPIEQAILAGSTHTGVSIMQIVKEMDAGPLFAQQKVTINGGESKQQLADKLLGASKDLLIDCLPEILSGVTTPQPQADEGVSYSHKIKKLAGELDWQQTAVQLERQIRAYAGWPNSRTRLAGKDVIITQAHVETSASTGVIGQAVPTVDNLIGIATADGVLVIDKLKPSGKQQMTAQEFLRGYRDRL